jgi:hypothetical protein
MTADGPTNIGVDTTWKEEEGKTYNFIDGRYV